MNHPSRLFWLFFVGGLAIGGVAVADPFGGPPHRFQADTVISASQMNANFDAITAYLNQLESELESTRAELAELTSSAQFPAGTVVAFAGPTVTIPEGWELCDGRELSRAEYPGLFAAIGTVHGHGDGATTFHLPDYRGTFLRGVDLGRGRDPDASTRSSAVPGSGNIGDQVGSVQADAFQAHIHRFTQTTGSIGAGLNDWFGKTNNQGPVREIGASQYGATEAYGIALPDGHRDYGPARFARETRPVNAAVHYIIKL